jgi:magnesium-transporting ATPase (P-type)
VASEDKRDDWHALNAESVIARFESNVDRGLSLEQARERLQRFGPNALPETERRSAFSVLLGQLKSPLIYLLIVAAIVAFALGHRTDAVVILGVVLLNALIGAMQEGRAEKSMEALRKLESHKARLIRGGTETMLEARDVVPGDILLLEAGDALAADARILHGATLQIAEAALTGESLPVAKDVQPLAQDTVLADRKNMAYAGTHVTGGRARVLVVATGKATEIGRIAALAGTAEQPKTPLEQRIAQFGRYIIVAAVVVFASVIGIGLLRQMPLGEIVMIGISQVVGMIPEGLPVAMTIALAVGVQRMAKRRAVVRRLSAVETLGSTTIICTDKTGTLTRNEMTVTEVLLPGGRSVTVSGIGYDPEGAFRHGDRDVELQQLEGLEELLEAVVLCNDAQLVGPAESEPRFKPIGDPTEVALVVLGMKAGIVASERRERALRRAELPFDPNAKLMATEHETHGKSRVIVKGAPEVVLKLCSHQRQGGEAAPLDDGARDSLRRGADALAEKALRVLAVAVIDGVGIDTNAGFAALEGRLTLLGLLGELDPPRPEVKDAVLLCRKAGIRPVMVTGDHKATGQAIALALGIAQEGDLALDGQELERLSDAELSDRIERVSVFARVHPTQKLRIVEAFQKCGNVVAMTGDGVNDAPALVKADVGVAMGITGTEVAKESAKIIIGDDNFSTIVAAVEEGRVAYRNIKKAVLLLFSTSAAEVIILLAAMSAGYPAPFAAVQILWNNLVSEGLVTINLIMEPAEGDEMSRRPISTSEPLLTRILLVRMAFMVPTIVALTLGWFILRTNLGVPAAEVRTETFTLLIICEWYNVLNCRSETKSALTPAIFSNRFLLGGLLVGMLLHVAVLYFAPLGRLFRTVPLGLFELGVLLALGSLVLWVEEARKLVVRRVKVGGGDVPAVAPDHASLAR